MVTVHVAAVVAGRCVHCGARADNTTGDWCSRTRTGSGMARAVLVGPVPSGRPRRRGPVDERRRSRRKHLDCCVNVEVRMFCSLTGPRAVQWVALKDRHGDILREWHTLFLHSLNPNVWPRKR